MKDKNGYTHFSVFEGKINIKDALCLVRVGDLIKVNDWRQPMRVKCVSQNYFVMTANRFGKIYYSVVSKRPWTGKQYNALVEGLCYCGTDDWVFGSPLQADCENLYHFNDIDKSKEYLESFEKGECDISCRTAISIMDLYIKPAEEKLILIEHMKSPTTTTAVNRMGCSENWYDPYYAIKETFSIEEIQAMSEKQIKNLVRLASNIAEGLY